MLSDLTLSMAGSGGWKSYFPDDNAYALYRTIYPSGLDLTDLDASTSSQIDVWEQLGFVQVTDKRVLPQIPVMTQKDTHLFEDWFQNASTHTANVLSNSIDQYRALSERLSDDHVSPDQILTLLICGHTLDVGTLRELENGLMGKPPQRLDTGTYFFWGQECPALSRYHFGVNTNGTDQFVLRLMWGRHIKRIAQNRTSICIPVFDQKSTEAVKNLCVPTSKKLAEAFTSGAKALTPIIQKATFSQCPIGDVLCMLFHIGYEKMAQVLIEKELLPDFPEVVDDAWGLWIHWQGNR